MEFYYALFSESGFDEKVMTEAEKETNVQYDLSCYNVCRYLPCMHEFFVSHGLAVQCNCQCYVLLRTKDFSRCNNHYQPSPLLTFPQMQ